MQKLPGANWWVRVANGDPPEVFLVDYFRPAAASVTVRRGSPADRVPMIPLMVSPHRWRVLDTNASIFWTAYVSTGSFTHYMRYTQTVSDPGGAWFTAVTDDGRAVGLATARPTTTGRWRVDGFAQHWFSDAWPELISQRSRLRRRTARRDATSTSLSVTRRSSPCSSLSASGRPARGELSSWPETSSPQFGWSVTPVARRSPLPGV